MQNNLFNARIHGQAVSVLRHRSRRKGSAHTLGRRVDLINVLLFIAKADGMVQAAEIAAIATAAADITGDKNITPGAASAALKMLDTPTLHGFKLAFGRIRKADPNVANKVAQAAHRIVGTQKTIHPAEQAALDYIDKAAGKSG